MDYEMLLKGYEYLTWYELKTPLEIYNFIQEMINDGVNLDNYPDIKTYYNMLMEQSKKDDADMVIVDYVVNRLRNLFIQYGFAHDTYTMRKQLGKRLYFYWNEGRSD